MPKLKSVAYLSIGSNIDAYIQIPLALQALHEGFKLLKVSRFYENEAVGKVQGSDVFLNGLVKLETTCSLSDFKAQLREIEERFGRHEDEKLCARKIDLDISVFQSEDESYFHPDLCRRDFVFVPFLEIEPEFSWQENEKDFVLKRSCRGFFCREMQAVVIDVPEPLVGFDLSKYEAIIFDCDGVLVDSEQITFPVLLELLAKNGVELTSSEAFALYAGRTLVDCVAITQEKFKVILPEDFIEVFDQTCYARFRKELEPVEGVEAVLEACRLPYCLASSGPFEKLDITLATTDMIRFFPKDKVFSADLVEHGKPAPDLFLKAAESCGFEPSRCLVIEDSPSGVRAAKAAGMGCLAYKNHDEDQREALVLAGAEVFTSMGSLANLLNL